jgi:hypothetical protein
MEMKKLKLLRPDHGREQIGEESQGNEPGDDGFHGSSEVAAEAGVAEDKGEEAGRGGEVDEVVHGRIRFTSILPRIRRTRSQRREETRKKSIKMDEMTGLRKTAAAQRPDFRWRWRIRPTSLIPSGFW